MENVLIIMIMIMIMFNIFFLGYVSRVIVLQNLAQRRQLAIYKRKVERSLIKDRDRLFWILLSKIWSDWKGPLVIVKPQTVLDWKKRRFKRYWKKVCFIKKRIGRPPIPKEHIDYIREISSDHPDYGEDRIAGFLKENFGIEHSTATIRRYMIKHPKDSRDKSQKWRTFLKKQAKGIWACDFMVEYTITFDLLYVFVINAD